MQNKVNYLRIIITEKCNLSCPYCHHEGLINNSKSIEMPNLCHLMEAFYNAGIRKFKFLGGEPTLYTCLPEIISKIKLLGSDTDISIVSNGLFSYDYLTECFANGLSRVNISVHVWDEKNLKKFNMKKTQLYLMKDNIERLLCEKKLGKINYVYVSEENYDELFEIIQWVDSNRIILDVLNVLGKYNEKCYSIEEIESIIKSKIPIIREYVFYNAHSLPSKRLVLSNGGEINLKVYPLNKRKPFNCCSNCKLIDMCTEGICAIRLTPDGIIKPCLFRNDNLFKVISCDGLQERIQLYLENL